MQLYEDDDEKITKADLKSNADLLGDVLNFVYLKCPTLHGIRKSGTKKMEITPETVEEIYSTFPNHNGGYTIIQK